LSGHDEQAKRSLTIASRPTVARERFLLNLKSSGGAAAAEAQRSASGASGMVIPRAALGVMDGEAQVSTGLTRDPPAPVER
jgi:hypothetical protein